MSNENQIAAIKAALSAARIHTFEIATGARSDTDPAPLRLYLWNAQISGALLVPLHICEIVIRNAVADALEQQYGERWPWSSGFEQSLPATTAGYNARLDLLNARRHAPATGKVIPELKFAFWQRLFTRRHDGRLWNAQLLRILPGLDDDKPVAALRKMLYDELDAVRNLRNRIAHHEPIFSRDLTQELTRINQLVGYRSTVVAKWLQTQHYQQTHALLQAKPPVLIPPLTSPFTPPAAPAAPNP